MSFHDAQLEVGAWIQQFKEGYFPPLAMLARLTEEVGELAREINHQFGGKTAKPDEPRAKVDEEIADILFVVICMANSLQIDLDTAFAEVMKKYRTRDAERWTRK